MTPLFVSYVCDYCDGLVEVSWFSGYIVFRGEDDFSRPVFVFPTRMDAALYRQANNWQHFPIREVHFEQPVQWRPSRGSITGITLAAQPFELHRDHRFESVPYSAYLVPLRSDTAAA